MMPASRGWSDISARTCSAMTRRVTWPTFIPKGRRSPRIACSVPVTPLTMCLRAVMRVLAYWLSMLFTCTALVPAGPHDLSNPARIVAISLDRHCGAGAIPGKPPEAQVRSNRLRSTPPSGRPSSPTRASCVPEGAEIRRDVRRLCRDDPLSKDRTGLVDNAD